MPEDHHLIQLEPGKEAFDEFTLWDMYFMNALNVAQRRMLGGGSGDVVNVAKKIADQMILLRKGAEKIKD